MTDQPPQKRSSPTPRERALSVLMIIVGVVLLLPGLCAIVAMSLFGGRGDPGLIAIGMACLAISGGGIWLIVAGRRIVSSRQE